MLKITPEQVQEVVGKHFNQSDPLLGFCVAQKIKFGFMNFGSKYIGYSNHKIIVCQMLGTNKDIFHETILFSNILKLKKTKIPIAKIFKLKYMNDRMRKSTLKLWFLSVRGYKGNVAESMVLIEKIKSFV